MTVPERWTVYPLLFLALILAARDKLIPNQDVVFGSIECQELVLTTVNNEPLIRLGESQDSTGMILVYTPVFRNGTARPSVTKSRSQSETSKADPATGQLSEKGQSGGRRQNGTRIPIIEISGDRAQGYVRVMSGSFPSLQLGHRAEQQVSGLMGIDDQDELLSKDKTFVSPFWGQLFTWEDFPRSEPTKKSPKKSRDES